jgi:filamin
VNNSSQREPASFTIYALDKNGYPKNSGGDLFDVFIEDPLFDLLPAKITDHQDGTYTVEYRPTEPGIHHIDVVLRNKAFPLDWEHISNSPIDVMIKAGTDPSHCIAEGPGLKDGILDTHPAIFTIYARDRDDNPITEGGDPFEVVILDPNNKPIPVEVIDNKDGTYGVTYNPDFPGPHTVNVTLDGKPIKDVPKIVQVKAGAWPRKTLIEEFSFIIRSKDKRGQYLKEGGQDIKCSIKDPSGNVLPTVKLSDRKDGSYLVVYSLPAVEGDYSISCTVEDQEIYGSPFIQTVANVYDD